MASTFDPRPYLDHAPRAFLRRTQGRETFAIEDSALPGGRAIVKRTHGDPRGERWYDRWRMRRGPSPGRIEHDNLIELAAAGLAVPGALSWCDERAPDGGRRSLVVLEHVEHDETLRDRLARVAPFERRELLERLAVVVARLHAAGWHHRDLYVQHVLVRRGDGTLVLIDVARARRDRAARPRWYVKDLAAVLHSLPIVVGPRERLRFLAAWLDARGIVSRRARRRWIAAAERKRARIAAHVPRDERGLVGSARTGRTST